MIAGLVGANNNFALDSNGVEVPTEGGFAGRIDETAWYDHVLSAADIQDHWNAAHGKLIYCDWDRGQICEATLTNDATIRFVHPRDGQEVELDLIQDGVGGHAPTLPLNVKWIGGSAPSITTTPNKRDIVKLTYRANIDKYFQAQPAAQNM